jgi:hypothetical protein
MARLLSVTTLSSLALGFTEQRARHARELGVQATLVAHPSLPGVGEAQPRCVAALGRIEPKNGLIPVAGQPRQS